MDDHCWVDIVFHPGFVVMHGIDVVRRIFRDVNNALKVVEGSIDFMVKSLRVCTVLGDVDVVLPA